MIDFEKYLENHLDEGEYQISGSEYDDEVEEDEDVELDEKADSNGQYIEKIKNNSSLIVQRKDSLHLAKAAEKS